MPRPKLTILSYLVIIASFSGIYKIFVEPGVKLLKEDNWYSFNGSFAPRPFWPQYWRRVQGVPEPDSSNEIFRSDDCGYVLITICIFEGIGIIVARNSKLFFRIDRNSRNSDIEPTWLFLVMLMSAIIIAAWSMLVFATLFFEDLYHFPFPFGDQNIAFWPNYWRSLRLAPHLPVSFFLSPASLSKDGSSSRLQIVSSHFVIICLIYLAFRCRSLFFKKTKTIANHERPRKRLTYFGFFYLACTLNAAILLMLPAYSIAAENRWYSSGCNLSRPFWPVYWCRLRHIPEPEEFADLAQVSDGGWVILASIAAVCATAFACKYKRIFYETVDQ